MANVEIRTGRSEGDQIGAFQNATLQGHGDTALSIAVHLDIPEVPASDEEWIKFLTATFADLPSYVSVEIELGPSDEAELATEEAEWDEEDEDA